MKQRNMPNSLFEKWMAIVWLLIAAFSISPVGVPVAEAHHRRTGDNRWHQRNIHWSSPGRGVNDEEYCVESRTTHISDSAALGKVDHALFSTGYPRWDGLQRGDGSADWRVELWGMTNPCQSYTSTQRDGIEIEVHVSKYNSDINNANPPDGYKWCREDKSCVYQDTPVRYTVNNVEHQGYTWTWVYLDLDNMSNTTESDEIVNHEFGYVYGLYDGAGTCPEGESIMHNRWYFCPAVTRIIPSVNDLNSVQQGADQ